MINLRLLLGAISIAIAIAGASVRAQHTDFNSPKFQELRRRLDAYKAQHASGQYGSASSGQRTYSNPGQSYSNPALSLTQTPMEGIPSYPNISVVTGKSNDHPSARNGVLMGQTSLLQPTSKKTQQIEKMLKFYTSDQPSSVYQFYVSSLQRNGWQFTQTKQANEINAKQPAGGYTVLIRYEQLPAPYRGTAVAISHIWSSAGAADHIMIGASPDIDDSHLRLLKQ